MPPIAMPDTSSNIVTPDAVAAAASHATFADALIAASPDCLKRLDLDGNLLWIGEAAARQLEIDDVEAHRNTCWFGWWDDGERGKVERAIAEARGGRSARFEAWAPTRSGESRLWAVTVHPIVDASGRPVELLAASRDVTTTRALAALAALHRRRPAADALTFEASDDLAIFALDLAGRIQSWNAAAVVLFGHAAEQIVGRDGDVLWTPEDRAAGVPARERASAAATGVARDERWHQRGDGARAFVDGAMLARRDVDGRVAGFVKICRDETTHRRIQDELVETRRRLDSALIAGEIGTYEWEIGSDRVRGDANFQRIFGIPLGADGSLPIAAFLAAIHADDRAATVARIERAVAGVERYETEYRIVDGPRERWVIARGHVDRDAAGAAGRFAGVVLDVTDRKRAEAEREAIAEHGARQARVYETILSTTDDFMYIFDLEGRVMYANPRLLEVWGVTLEHAVGLTLVELGYPVWHAAMHRKEIDEVIRTRRPIQGEIPFAGASGQGGVYDYVFTPVIGPDGAVERVVGVTRDVTSRRHAEDAARLSAARARFLADFAESTRATADPNALTADALQRLGEYLGASRCVYADVADDQNEFVIHRDYCDVGVTSAAGRHALDDFGPVVAKTLRAGRTLIVRDAALEIEAADARALSAIAVRATIACALIQNGRLVAIMAAQQSTPREWSADDVSLVESVFERTCAYLERARGVRALAESEQRLRQLADAMPQIVFAATPDGHVDYFNRRWYEYTGLPEGSVGFESWRHVHDERRLPEVSEQWARATRDGTPYQVDYPLRRADGAWRWHLGRALPVRDGAGAIVRWFGTNTDVHDQKLAADAMREGKQQLAVALEAGRLGTWEVDLRTRQLTCSDACKANYGRSPDRPFTYDDLWAACHADDRAPTEAILRRAIETRADYVAEHRVLWPGDTLARPHWTSVRGRVTYADDGTPLRIAGVNQDVTERKRAEAERERVLEAERAARAESERAGRMKDEFLATLSHELRTPLSAILGWSQMLARDGVTSDSLRKGLSTIERNARAQTQIIEDLLDMSRIISGKVTLDTRQILLADVVRAAVETVGPTASAKQIDLIVDLGGHEPTPVLGDANRLQQVFWNLLTNAVKFTPRGGTIRASLTRRASQWRVDVVDSGEGIRPDFLPFVFDRFRQADASTTRKHGGLGLGLAIVKQIVELHGGTVGVRSDGEGRGATFTVALPMSAVQQTPAESPTTPAGAAGPPPVAADGATGATGADSRSRDVFGWDVALAKSLAGLRVLVVDDEPDARAMLRHLLESCQAIVEEASGAEAGVERFRAFRPDVLVSDVGMPGENGYAMLARIRALPGGADVPAVALTAYARADDRIRAIRAGFQLHVPKPVEPAELIASVASLVARRD